MDARPHRNAQGFAGFYTPDPNWPLPDTWFRREAPNAGLERATQERLARWAARKEASERGEPTLTRTQLGDLIVRAQAAMDRAGPGDRLLLAVQLDDMNREYEARTFLEEEQTEWPADAADEPAER